jgi:hypothetical protein
VTVRVEKLEAASVLVVVDVRAVETAWVVDTVWVETLVLVTVEVRVEPVAVRVKVL